ncbi:MAG: LytTR family DNA-binding domain-containing protein [Balneolia bacterium]|nr:LytTR family DNA-binding domain-containing protein [Balneolia bacterium]
MKNITLRALIIDDQHENREHLAGILNAFENQIEITGEAGSCREAITLIKQEKPDLLFLDVELGDGTGFDILSELPEFTGMVVFVTAFEKYAVRAFRTNAIDYVLKPAGADDIRLMLEKVGRRRSILTGDSAQRKTYHLALKNAAIQQKSREPAGHVVISSSNGMEMIGMSSISYIEADNTYSLVNLKSGRQVVASRPLIEFEELLDENRFFRIHRSYLINMESLKRYKPGESVAILENGAEIPVSRRKSAAFSDFIKRSAAG